MDAQGNKVSGELWHTFDLAERLGMTVKNLKHEMTNIELMLWQRRDTVKTKFEAAEAEKARRKK